MQDPSLQSGDMLSSSQEGTLKELFTATCNNALPSRARSTPSFSAHKASSTPFVTSECSAKDAPFSRMAIKAPDDM